MKRFFGSIVIAFTFASCGDNTDALQKEMCNCYQELKKYSETATYSGENSSYSSKEFKKRSDECYKLLTDAKCWDCTPCR